MNDTNVQNFLDTLTEEQRAAVLACKTEEELEQVIDDYDIELPDEMLTEVTGGKGFLPMLMAGIMTFSSLGTTIATVGAAAAATGIVIASSSDITASAANVTGEDYAKMTGIEMGDAALDTVGQTFPGANILIAPFKTLFHANVDSPDPMQMMMEKLDSNIEKIQERLETLSHNMDTNTQWLAQKIDNKIDMSAFLEDFRDLDAKLDAFAKDIKAAETYPGCNNTQKIMRLARLMAGENYRDVNFYCNKLKHYMASDRSSDLFPCMYDALYTSRALYSMSSREALAAAYPVAQVLTEEYVYAVLMLAECQRAAGAVYKFTEDDVAQLGNGVEKSYYDAFKNEGSRWAMDDASEQLDAAAKGIKKFLNNYNDGRLIYKNKKEADGKTPVAIYPECSIASSVKLYNRNNVYQKFESNIGSYVSKSTFSFDEIKELADYVRTKYPGTSLYQYLKEWAPAEVENLPGSGTAYLLTSDKERTAEEEDGTKDLGAFAGGYLYNCTVYAKGIDIYDPNCAEKEFTICTYVRNDFYGWGIHLETKYFKSQSYYNNIFTIRKGNAPSSDNYKDKFLLRFNDVNTGLINKYDELKKLLPDLSLQEFTDFLKWREEHHGMIVWSDEWNAYVPMTLSQEYDDFKNFTKFEIAYPNSSYEDFGIYKKLGDERYRSYIQWKSSNPSGTVEEFEFTHTDYAAVAKAHFDGNTALCMECYEWHEQNCPNAHMIDTIYDFKVFVKLREIIPDVTYEELQNYQRIGKLVRADTTPQDYKLFLDWMDVYHPGESFNTDFASKFFNGGAYNTINTWLSTHPDSGVTEYAVYEKLGNENDYREFIDWVKTYSGPGSVAGQLVSESDDIKTVTDKFVNEFKGFRTFKAAFPDGSYEDYQTCKKVGGEGKYREFLTWRQSFPGGSIDQFADYTMLRRVFRDLTPEEHYMIRKSLNSDNQAANALFTFRKFRAAYPDGNYDLFRKYQKYIYNKEHRLIKASMTFEEYLKKNP